MMSQETPEQRIRRMELYFDTLTRAAQEAPEWLSSDEALGCMLRKLTEYYDSGLWLQDYTLDEAGQLPQELKRGVLSEDGVYDLLTKLSEYPPEINTP